MTVSIYEIAAKAGVSHATVSMALRDYPRISKSRREQIQRLAKEMGYRPNMLSRGLKAGKTKTIGMILSGWEIEATMNRAKAIVNTASMQGYRVFASYPEDLDQGKQDIDRLLGYQVDGLIVYCGAFDGNYLQSVVDRGVPVVVIDWDVPGTISSVAMDFEELGAMAIQHLVKKGRRKIAIISGAMIAYSQALRLEGWRRGCRETGLDFNSLPLLMEDADGSPEAAFRLTEKLVHSGQPFDAIVASNDIWALSIMHVLTLHGIKIPEDVAVIGHDDNTFGRYLPVPLTTFRHPAEKVGHAAMDLLLRHIHETTYEPEKIVIKPELIIRESTMVRDEKSKKRLL